MTQIKQLKDLSIMNFNFRPDLKLVLTQKPVQERANVIIDLVKRNSCDVVTTQNMTENLKYALATGLTDYHFSDYILIDYSRSYQNVVLVKEKKSLHYIENQSAKFQIDRLYCNPLVVYVNGVPTTIFNMNFTYLNKKAKKQQLEALREQIKNVANPDHPQYTKGLLITGHIGMKLSEMKDFLNDIPCFGKASETVGELQEIITPVKNTIFTEYASNDVCVTTTYGNTKGVLADRHPALGKRLTYFQK